MNPAVRKMDAARAAVLSLLLWCMMCSGSSWAAENSIFNPVKQKLQDGQIVKGLYMGMPEPVVAAIFGRSGFDFIWIDLEHTSLDWRDAELLIQAISESPAAPLIRVPWNRPDMIKRALDIGAKGIIVPMVNTGEEALAAVRACRYPPHGIRGFGPAKAAFHWGLDLHRYIEAANREILVIVQIEHEKAVENIDEIFAVKGVDMAMVGPMDLSASMGLLGKPAAPRVLSAIDRVIEAGKRHRVPVGTLSLSTEEYEKRAAQGFQFFLVGSDFGILTQGAQELYQSFKEQD